jgi:6-phosphogluconolactonase
MYFTCPLFMVLRIALPEASASGYFVFVGTYTDGDSEGIYVYRMDMQTGALALLSKAPGVENPSYLAISPSHKYLYAVNQLMEFNGQSGGAVSAFSIDGKTGNLTLLNQQPSHGAGPCYVSVDQNGEWVLVANYGGGTLAIFPVEGEGKLGEATDVVQHKGKSVNRKRQKSPHPHAIVLGPSSPYAFAVDLGIDRVINYKFDPTHGKLLKNKIPFTKTAPGSGPRHLTFHPNGKFAFLILELNSSMTSLHYNSEKGAFSEIQTISTLPDGFDKKNKSADVHVAPSGRFLYGSNRGHDSVVIYKIDQTTGKLTMVGFEPTQGRTPRNFAIDPTGRFLLVANQNSNNIVSFSIDQTSGKLKPTGNITILPNPVCLKFMSAE